MEKMAEKAFNYFKEGYSCSESVVRAAYDEKLTNNDISVENLTRIASAFSGGMGESGCLCGAVAGVQIVLGSMLGRYDAKVSPVATKALSKKIVTLFREKRNATCCKALSAGYDFHSPERRENCSLIVNDAVEVFKKVISEAKNM